MTFISATVQNFAKLFSPEVGPLNTLQNPLTMVGVGVPLWGSGAPNQKNHILRSWNYSVIAIFILKFSSTEGTGVKVCWDWKPNRQIFFEEMGVQSFWGCGTFSSSRTSGVRGHTVHYQPFTGWWKRFLNNVDFYFRFAVMGFWNFWKVTNLGQNTQNPFDKIILIFVSRNSVGSTQRQREKIAIPQFEQFVFENSKNTFGRYFSNAGFLWTRIILVLPASNIYTKFRRGR